MYRATYNPHSPFLLISFFVLGLALRVIYQLFFLWIPWTALRVLLQYLFFHPISFSNYLSRYHRNIPHPSLTIWVLLASYPISYHFGLCTGHTYIVGSYLSTFTLSILPPPSDLTVSPPRVIKPHLGRNCPHHSHVPSSSSSFFFLLLLLRLFYFFPVGHTRSWILPLCIQPQF